MPTFNLPPLFGQNAPSLSTTTPPFVGSPVQAVQQNSRMGQILGNMAPFSPQPLPEPNPLEGIAEPSQIDPNAFVPSTEASDRFNDFLKTYPGFQKPGMLAKVVAGLMSWNNPKAGMDFIRQQPQLEEWKSLLPPLEQAAREERMSNREGRMTSQTNQRMDLNERKFKAQGDLAQQKLEVMKFKTEHPNWISKEDIDGSIVFFNPQDPSAPPINTGVKSIHLSPFEKSKLSIQEFGAKLETAEPYKVAASDRSADTQKEMQEMRNLQQETIAQLRDRLQQTRDDKKFEQILMVLAEKNKDAVNLKGSPYYSDLHPELKTGAAAKESELDRRRRHVNNAEVLLAQDPSLSTYITVEGDKVTLEPVGAGWFSKKLTKEKRDDLYNKIFGGDEPGRPSPMKPASSHESTVKPKADPLGIRK